MRDDLLNHARMLVSLDPGVPSQVNLRRAVSSPYYALFHLLIAEVVALLVPAEPAMLGEVVSRSFAHREMDRICLDFSRSPLTDRLQSLLPVGVSAELKTVTRTFSQLQLSRHGADYDLSSSIPRAAALARIKEVEDAFTAWQAVKGREESKVFLTALAFGARWSR